MADGCIEKMDLEFIGWILHGGRTRERRGSYRQIASLYPDKTFLFKSPKQVDAFMARTRREIGAFP